MLALAFEIFGIVSLATGFCLLALAAYVKVSYGVTLQGIRACAVKAGGGTRFVVAVALGVVFSSSGLAMVTAAHQGLV